MTSDFISHSYSESDLIPGDKVDVVVLLHSLLDPLGQHFREALVNFEPSSVKSLTERSSVCLIMAVEIVAQKSSKLLLVIYV